MDAPTDGFMLTKKAKNPDAAKAVLEYIGTADAEAAFLTTDSWDVGLANGLIAPTYNDIQKKAVVEIGKCKNVAAVHGPRHDPRHGDRDDQADPGLHRRPEHVEHCVAPEERRDASKGYLR